MPLIEWSDAYSVGVGKFDVHHKELLSKVNALHAAMTAGRGDCALGDMLHSLVAYTNSHFAAEEVAMAQFQVPGLESHKSEHQMLRSQVVKFAGDFAAGRAALSDDILILLKSWLVEHIQKSDKSYGPHLQDKSF